MKKPYSIWLVPEENDENYLKNIIHKLALNYDSPSFIPHLTLFPGINIEYKEIKQIITEIFNKQNPFEIKKTGTNQSDNFWKTVFIEFELNHTLNKLYKDLSNKTDHRNISLFKPHISLVYKSLSEEERINILKNINVKSNFIIDKVIINAPKDGDEDFLDIPNWQNPFIKTL